MTRRSLSRPLAWGLLSAFLLAATGGEGTAAEDRADRRRASGAPATSATVQSAPGEVVTLAKADLLPLALSDQFSFRKKQLFLNDSEINRKAGDKMIEFERMRYDYGAVSEDELNERRGHYFTFYWRAERPANLKVRLEYRQANLGAYVQAKEVAFSAPSGTHKTKFQVTGDEYLDDGPVLAWRALLIEDGRIVALTQSFLWN